MKIEQFLKLGLSDEQAKKVMELCKEDKRNFIPKSRFDTLNEKKKKLEMQVMVHKTQLDEMLVANEQNKRLHEQAGQIWEHFISFNRKQEELLREFLILSAIFNKLSGVVSVEFVMDKIDRSKLTLTTQGEILGLDKQLMDIQTEYPHYF
ncbi:hypothetical protein acsn021_01560 [Anaerocolumna cellulosilytica]|uniref:Uncharacterized protein n=1 Tax=Anaerocolumna cellulosilytica TaxID=433286 RepID=A0A6S6QXG5_9FIRM|nr:phage scaffolding protein [Anaerocolumna cellulosilytica]MBB5197940.1 DNA-binding transcriptional MerR regulator [Anaerocolumna cellulosilytica]BCJ92587.1 hypothetical protein acsn021_01560 [Anaerocolumna cellulosilytica]